MKISITFSKAPLSFRHLLDTLRLAKMLTTQLFIAIKMKVDRC